MATSNWWFKLDFRVWRTDPDLRECSLETRGFWLDVLCVMHERETDTLTGSYERLARSLGCSPEDVARCCIELKATNAADVTIGNGDVTLVSRRLSRELSGKENNRLRQERHRGNADVTPVSQENNGDVTRQSKSKSKSKEEDKEQEAASPRATPEVKERLVFTGKVLGGVLAEFGLKKLPATDRRLWDQYAELAHANGFTADQFLDCLSLLRRQHWRTSAVKPKHVFDSLPNIDKIRNEVTNGSNRTNSFGHKQTPAEVIAGRTYR